MKTLVWASLWAVLGAGQAAAQDGGVRHFKWDVPRALEEVPVSGKIQALGVPMKLHAVRSAERMDALFSHFLTLFEKEDLYVPPRAGQFQIPGGLQLTGLDVKTKVSYTVIFQPNPDGTTTVVLGEGDLAHRVAPESERVGVPVFPGAQHVFQSASESASTVTYEVSAPPADLAAFYRDAMGRAGYEEVNGVFVKDGAEVKVLAKGNPDAGALFVTIVQTGKDR